MWVYKVKYLEGDDVFEVWSESFNYKKDNVISVSKKWVTNRERLSFLSFYTKELNRIIESGLPLINGISILKGKKNSYMDFVSQDIVKHMLKGKTLSEAMSEYKNIFPKEYIASIKSGETSGKLEKVTKRLSQHSKWSHENYQAIIKSMVYPFSLLVVLFIVSLIYVIFLLPSMESLMVEMNIEVPWYSKLMFFISDNYSYLVLFILISALSLFHPIISSFIFSKIRKIKCFGSILESRRSSYLFNNISMCFDAGVPIISILKSEYDQADGEEKKALYNIYNEVNNGSKVSLALDRNINISQKILISLRSGEESGKLDVAFNEAAIYMDKNYQKKINSLMSMASPLVLFVMFILLVWMILSIFIPIYSVVGFI